VKRFRLVRGEIYFADQESDRIIIRKNKKFKRDFRIRITEGRNTLLTLSIQP